MILFPGDRTRVHRTEALSGAAAALLRCATPAAPRHRTGRRRVAGQLPRRWAAAASSGRCLLPCLQSHATARTRCWAVAALMRSAAAALILLPGWVQLSLCLLQSVA